MPAAVALFSRAACTLSLSSICMALPPFPVYDRGLLVVASETGVGFVEGAVLYGDAAFGHLLELEFGFVVEVAGEVFGRGVERGERLEVVDHLVVEVVDDGAHDLLEELEV